MSGMHGGHAKSVIYILGGGVCERVRGILSVELRVEWLRGTLCR